MQADFSPDFSMVAALDWLTATMLGVLGTSLAVLAIAALGFAMLQGRLPVRRGAAVVIGCFILFSARIIAVGLLNAEAPAPSSEAPAQEVARPVYTAPVPPPVAYDPYAGASVPVRPPDEAGNMVPR